MNSHGAVGQHKSRSYRAVSACVVMIGLMLIGCEAEESGSSSADLSTPGGGGGGGGGGSTAPTLSYSGATGTTGVVGAAMSVSPTTLSANGASVTSCGIKNGTSALPSTLTVNASTCVISGSPTSALSTAVFTLNATNAAGTSSDATVSLTVSASASAPTLSYAGASGTTGTAGSAMSVSPTTLSENGASVTSCGIKGGTTALPATLTVNASTCVISGTPMATLGATMFTLNATNVVGTSSDATVTLTINAGVPSLSYAGATGTTGTVGTAMSVTPPTLTTNGAAITNCAIKGGTTALPGTLSVNTSTCVISGTPSATLGATVFTLNATNSAGTSADATVSLTINAGVPGLSYSGASGTSVKINNAMSVSPPTLSTNGAAITACGIKSGTTALPGTLTVHATTCVISGTPTALLNTTAFTLQATNSVGVSADATVNLTVTPLACPTGYIKIAANATLGTSDLCFAQYEMKNDGAGNAVVTAAGAPYIVTRATASTKCTAIDAAYRIPTSTEFNAAALNAYNNAANWSGSSVGSGYLYTGVTIPWSNPISITNTSDPYNQTGYSSSDHWEQARTLTLTNGTIWDLGGNAWEWVSDTLLGSSYSPDLSGTSSLNPWDTYWFPNPSSQKTAFYPTITPANNNADYVGKTWGGNTGYVARGGGMAIQTTAADNGLFSASLGSASTDTVVPYLNVGNAGGLINSGFRCVVEPF